MKTTVGILIPIYKSELSPAEKLSLKYLKKYLSGYPVRVFTPEKLKLPSVINHLPNVKQIVLPSKYFRSVKDYSQLWLTESFYQNFTEFEYILTYQLDALVLKNELEYWIAQKYDYIGAPWHHSIISFINHPNGDPNAVGNSGFSLRKVASHIKVLRQHNQRVKRSWLPPMFQLAQAILLGKARLKWFKSHTIEYPFNEDGFWSLEALKIDSNFKIAPANIAKKFAWEKQSPKYYSQLKQLPFGVHAWQRYDECFWREILEI